MGTKYSQFPASSEINTSDVLVGLHNDGNSRFSFSTILVWIRQSVASFFVPTSRTVNNKALSQDISLDAADVGARADTWMPSASDVGAQPTINANGILKGDGAGGVSAATAGTDYQAPLTIDATPTANSTNPVQSGGVYTDVRTRVPVYGLGKNLLDNWYFVNPVNQRGQSSYGPPPTAAGIYTIDRWLLSNRFGLAMTLLNGIKISADSNYQEIRQSVDFRLKSFLVGKEITYSVLYNNGSQATLVSNSIIVPEFPSSGTIYPIINIPLLMVMDSDGYIGFWLRVPANATYTFIAAKLELGTEQTLAHQENGMWILNEIPDYEEELIKCQTSTAGPSDTYANKSLATEQQLAYVESGTTASRTYAVGEYFCLNGLLYRAKTAISQGATFTVNTNCEQVTVGEDLLKLDNLIAKAPGSGTRDAQLQVGTYNSVATMNFVSLPSRSPGKPDVYVDFAETYIRVYYVKSDGTTTTKTYLPS